MLWKAPEVWFIRQAAFLSCKLRLLSPLQPDGTLNAVRHLPHSSQA